MSSTRALTARRLERLLPAIRERHIEPWVGTALTPAGLMDRAAVAATITGIYKRGGYGPPKVLFCGSVHALEVTEELVGMRAIVPRHEERRTRLGRPAADIRPRLDRRARMRRTAGALSREQWLAIVANVRAAPLRPGFEVFARFTHDFERRYDSDRSAAREALESVIRTSAPLTRAFNEARAACAAVGRWDCHRAMIYSLMAAIDPAAAELGWGPAIELQAELSRAAGVALFRRNLVLVAERHTDIRRDAAGRLHCDDSPAVTYPDGHGVYVVHGVRVEPSVRHGPITVEAIDAERNLEVRRVMIERFGGLERYIAAAGAVEVARDSCGVLLKRFYPHRGDTLAVVRVINSTPEPDGTRREYLLQVPHRVKTAREAVAWTFGMTPREYRPVAQT